MKTITSKNILDFKQHLQDEEKSENTIEKYMRDVLAFHRYIGTRKFDKSHVLEYKKLLCEKYMPTGVNSVISSLNALFAFMGWYDLKVKSLKIKKQIFSDKSKELTKSEYKKLLTVAQNKKNKRLYFLMQTLASTGLRVSEIKFITVEAVKFGLAKINCKGSVRQIFLPKKLCKVLKQYAKSQGIKSGSIFISRNGLPLNRSNIWKMLKSLCDRTGVSKDKVFPHNFRHLFARTFYSLQKDIVRLADILGHSSIETTRIYTMESGAEHIKLIQKLGLLMC